MGRSRWLSEGENTMELEALEQQAPFILEKRASSAGTLSLVFLLEEPGRAWQAVFLNALKRKASCLTYLFQRICNQFSVQPESNL